MSDHDDVKDGQDGPCVWGDDAELTVPALRTFRVLLDEGGSRADSAKHGSTYVEAHSVTCVADAAHFYVYRPTSTPEGTVLAAFMVRTLRPYLDCEDVTAVMATTSKQMN